jgi:cyclopropane fatty-acyl-phospholipid synthase-like methyltransferase
METVACNLCGSQSCTPVYEMPDSRYFPDEYFTVVECNKCGLGFVNPRPDAKEIQKHYPREYFQDAGTASLGRHLKKRFMEEARYLRRIESRAGPRKLLDVGCHNGDFPRFLAARGWEVEGVEISEVAQHITDFRVYLQEFHDIPVNQPTYDAVTAWAVLEHVHDPMAYFRKASQVLKKDGLFVFLVPNFVSTASRYLFCEDVPRHLYFYTRETVTRYLEKTGFVLEREDNRGNVYKMSPANWLSFIGKTKLAGKRFTYGDKPLSSRYFRKVHGLKPGIRASWKFAVYSPTSVVDRMLWPFLEAVEVVRKRYGTSTYVARKL